MLGGIAILSFLIQQSHSTNKDYAHVAACRNKFIKSSPVFDVQLQAMRSIIIAV